MIKKRAGFIFKVVLLTILLGGCATVPQETVELSYVMEENIAALKTSYIVLVNNHFDLLEKVRITYLENEWIPKFVEEWVANGRLLDIASGMVVWSDERNDFIQPERGMERQGLLSSTVFWAKAAVELIEERRQVLISPLEDQRKELLLVVEEEFDLLLRGNVAITAHLNSIRKVQEFQNKTFESLNIGDLKKEIDKRLLDISGYADQGLEAIRKADGFINAASSTLNL